MIIAAGCNLYLPWIIKDMIDDVLLNKDMETMKWICIGVVVVFLIRGVFYFGQTYLVSYVGQRVIVDVRSQLFKKFQRVSPAYYDDLPQLAAYPYHNGSGSDGFLCHEKVWP